MQKAFDLYKNLIKTAKNYNCYYEESATLAPYTTMKIGGKCDILVKPNSEESLLSLLKICKKENLPYRILGMGSNVLISDKGLSCAVIVLGKDMAEISVENNIITAQAGAKLISVCKKALQSSLTGLEFAYGIPGSVGGALFMNAGAYGGEIKDIISHCNYIEKGELKTMKAEEMQLSYRKSYFSLNNACITSVSFKLKKGDYNTIQSRMNELMQRRIDKQPLEYPSAGSTFKRPVGDYASRLIEVCGLKGEACGGAEVSTKHSGFVINKNNATFDDVLDVVNCVKQKVNEQTGIKLECEMLIWE